MIADERDEMASTPIYGHRAQDGKAFVSFGELDYPEVEMMDDYHDGIRGVTEWVESKWFDAWDDIDQDWIDRLPTEGERSDAAVSAPPQVGVLHYSHADEEVDAEIFEPEQAFNPDNR